MKKLFALVLALTCLLTVPALATEAQNESVITPSRTVKTVTVINDPVIVVVEPKEADIAELEALNEFVTTQSAPIVTYFPETVQTEIAAALPEGKDVSAIKVDEYIPLAATQPVSGQVDLRLSTAVKYNAEDALVVMFGVLNPTTGRMEWHVAAYTIDPETGELIITLSDEFVGVLSDSSLSTALMILSDREPEPAPEVEATPDTAQ